MAIKQELSLLPDSNNSTSFSAIFIKWLTTVGRWVIVLTELIVISAFISRFWLDRKNSDLSDVIRQKQAILESSQSFETDFLAFQKRLNFINTFYGQDYDYSNKIDSLIASTPKDLVYKNINFTLDPSTNKINAKATVTAFTEDSIIKFITNLMSNSDIETVKINQIEKKAKESDYSISLSAVFKTSPTKL